MKGKIGIFNRLFNFSFRVLFRVILIGIFITLQSCSLFNSSNSMNEEKAQIFYSQGTNFLLNKDYNLALENLLKAEELSSNNSKILNNLGMAYYFKNKWKLAKEKFQKSIMIEPKNSDARNNLASIYFHEELYDVAEKEYQVILTDLTYSHQYRVYYNLGLIKLKQKKKDIKGARVHFLNSLSEKEDFCPSSFMLGEISFGAKNYEEAYKYYFNASKGSCYSEPAPQYFQALTLFKMKKIGKAKQKFEEVISRFPKSEFAELSKAQLKGSELLEIIPATAAPAATISSSAEKTVEESSQSGNNERESERESEIENNLERTKVFAPQIRRKKVFEDYAKKDEDEEIKNFTKNNKKDTNFSSDQFDTPKF